MIKMKTSILALLAILLFTSSSFGEIHRLCKVSYQTESGMSNGYTMEVTFISGFELNQATNSFSYEPYSNYCLLWFAQGEVAILKIGSFVLRNGNEFGHQDFRNLFLLRNDIDCEQVNSKEPRIWTVTAREFINWIDARER